MASREAEATARTFSRKSPGPTTLHFPPNPTIHLEISSKLEESVEDKADTYRYVHRPTLALPVRLPDLVPGSSPRAAMCHLTGRACACCFSCATSYLNFHMLDDYVSKSEESFDVLAQMDAK